MKEKKEKKKIEKKKKERINFKDHKFKEYRNRLKKKSYERMRQQWIMTYSNNSQRKYSKKFYRLIFIPFFQ